MQANIPNDAARIPSTDRHHSMRFTSLLALILIAIVALTACGSSSSSSASNRPVVDGGNAPAENGGANGEAPGITYTNSRFKYRVDAPGPMTEAADGSAAYLGPAERLEIAVIAGAAAADPHRRAADDLSALKSTKPAYKLVDPLAQPTLSGKKVEKFVFSWTDGVNAVTGKPNDLVSARYYIAKNSSTLAIVTYSTAANQWDPQGADDVATTFTWQ